MEDGKMANFDEKVIDRPKSSADGEIERATGIDNDPIDRSQPEIMDVTSQIGNGKALTSPRTRSTDPPPNSPATATGEIAQFESEIEYVSMEDPLDKAAKFISKHDIFGLLQNITADIAYKRPTSPLQFMIEEIQKLQEENRRRQGIITPISNTTRAPKPGNVPEQPDQRNSSTTGGISDSAIKNQ